MNKETRMFFGTEVSFDEKKLRKLLASQSHNRRYIDGKRAIINVIFDRTLPYHFRREALELIFTHMLNQGVVVYGANRGLSTSELLTVIKNVL